MARPGLKRLPGYGRGLSSTHRLWLGDNYLLAVENTGYRETYHRIELADIQGFVIQHTATLTIRSLIFLGGALVFGALALWIRDIRAFWASLAALCLVVTAVDAALGATCTTHLRTPVQQLKLPSLCRTRRAHKIIALLSPRIEQLQARYADSTTPAPPAHPMEPR